MCRAAYSKCRHSLDTGGWFGGNRFHLRESYNQLLNLALFARLGKVGLSHGSIFAQCWAEVKPSFQCTIYEALPQLHFLDYGIGHVGKSGSGETSIP